MANNNNSDYNKKFMDLLEYLPTPYQSDVNESVFSNLFNRFLTKQEIEKISGYIGEGNANAIVSRQIKEPTIERQASQLQPILYKKIGSIEHMDSWDDIQNELTRLGIDMEKYQEWGATEKFNWVPPVDINKIINYQDYYWVDDNDTLPQYITVRSKCSIATAIVTFFDNLITQYGSTYTITEILKKDAIDQVFDVPALNQTTQQVFVTGDVTDILKINTFVELYDSVSSDGIYEVLSIPTYDGVTNLTEFTTSGISVSETSIKLRVREYDRLALSANSTKLDGDYTKLMEPGFVFFVRNVPNTELNNHFIKVISSEYDSDNNRTIVTMDLTISNDTIDSDSVASIEEQKALYDAEKRCVCSITSGWDETLWDDNPSDPLWGDDEDINGNPIPDGISDHTNLINRISNNVPPSAPGTNNELWFDTVGDVLYQYSTATGWNALWFNFSAIVNSTNGLALWDDAGDCDTSIRIPAMEQWSIANKWQHKNSITNFTNGKRATQPIIEYDWDLELNEWSCLSYKWSYRKENDADFVVSASSPELVEIEPITWWENQNNADPSNKTIIIDSRYGDLTDTFTKNKSFRIQNLSSIGTFTVNYSEFKKETDAHPYRTYVTFTEKIPLNVTENGDLSSLKPNFYKIVPLTTSNGDLFSGYGVHWLFSGVDLSKPVPHQPTSTYDEIDLSKPTIPVYSGATKIYEYRTSLNTQQYVIYDTNGVDTFFLTNEIFGVNSPINAIDSVQLTRKSLYGFDDIRVYVSDLSGNNFVRQIGVYDEISEAVLKIVGIDTSTNEFLIGGPFTSYFNIGDTIKLYGNDTIGTVEYTVSNISPSSSYRIRVLETIDPTATVTGELSNTTNPLPGDDFSNTSYSTVYVIGIKFFEKLLFGQVLNISVGPASTNDYGNNVINVRTDADNNDYTTNGNIPVSLIRYRKSEQIKTKTNQYPLFDIFTVDGEYAYEVNSIFGYRTSQDAPINRSTGLRIVYDDTTLVYDFDQFLLKEDNGELFAYRDYSNKKNSYWFNPETNKLYFWFGFGWSEKTVMSNHYRKAVVSDVEPTDVEKQIDGLYWYNTSSNMLFVRKITGSTGTWNEISNVDNGVTDINLQTIWKGGLNNDQYIPEKVDWKNRTLEEYNTEKTDFITGRVNELLASNPGMSYTEALSIATSEWNKSQINHLSSDGLWAGEWEIPDPLYYNNQHENRKYLTSRELYSHFNTIVEGQEKIPGFTGTKDAMFNLLSMPDVNYALGGTIKEFNNGFDTFLSSVFVDNVTPITLIEFANSQYEYLLNIIGDILAVNSVELLTNLDIDKIIGLTDYVAKEVINVFELSDNLDLIYGDSTTFTDVDGINDIGIKNFIATIPYIGLIKKQYPLIIKDIENNIYELLHHDGHSKQYKFEPATIDIIAKNVTSSIDPRTGNDLGKVSQSLPPNNVTEFINSFNGQIVSKEGVYWYTTTNTERTLYRYVVVESGTSIPPDTYPDGSLWMDLTPVAEVLRIKTTVNGVVQWNVVDGLAIGDARLHNGTDPSDVTTSTISAWKVVNLNELLMETLLDVEVKLYDNVPEFNKLVYDIDLAKVTDPSTFTKYMQESFLDYVSVNNISDPYLNSIYDINDPFTWNYVHSGQSEPVEILEADGLTNSFLVNGNMVNYFDPCTASQPGYTSCPSIVSFYMKRSEFNDGEWQTIQSISTKPAAYYDSSSNTTRVFVDGDVKDDLTGIIYKGVLPSPKTTNPAQVNNLNDGSESGGYWKDLYENIYGTAYPHREPWILQGYYSKPDWWDDEYLNNDISKWGDRVWKYKHGFNVVSTNNDSLNSTGLFGISGDFSDTFISNGSFTVDKSTVHSGIYLIANREQIVGVNPGVNGTASITIGTTPYTYTIGMKILINDSTFNAVKHSYTIVSVTVNVSNVVIGITEDIVLGDILIGSDYINGATYDPTTNITEIAVTSTLSSTTPSGRIATRFGMWENIRIGVIPQGRTYPNGITSVTGIPATDTTNGLPVPELPKFNYFSVNIANISMSDNGGTTNYKPDAVLPPYWDYTSAYNSNIISIDSIIRSIYYNFNSEIISSNAKYEFGDIGFVEYEWKTSSDYLYDKLNVAYRIDPVEFVYNTFGFDFTTIGNLKIDRDTKNTASHTRTSFHGDIIDNKLYQSNGMNQWYVNYNRYGSYDVSGSNFRELWTGWTAPMTYQFASFIDGASLEAAHRYVSISDFDYNITTKKSPGVEDHWIDALRLKILNIPYDITRYNNQLDWRFELRTNLKISRKINYYDVNNYQFYADPDTDLCYIYTWKIVDLDIVEKKFKVVGDQTHIFNNSNTVNVINSTGNDNTYNIINIKYDNIEKATYIFVDSIISSSVVDGLIRADYRSSPFNTGDGVYFSTTELLPYPLKSDDEANKLLKYFYIKVNESTFRIAETNLEALAGTYIDITTDGTRDSYVGKINSTFYANGSNRTNTLWRLYEIDERKTITISTPYEIQGLQTVVDLVHGYAYYSVRDGWSINQDQSLIDKFDRIVSFYTELENFIDYAYLNRSEQYVTQDRYSVTFDATTDAGTFLTENRTFITGDQMQLISSNGVLPTPLSEGIIYYVIRDSLDTFRLAASKSNALLDVSIDITTTSGVGDINVYEPVEKLRLPVVYEINPFRTAIWYRPKYGVVTDTIQGPSEDIRLAQLVFDQNGDKIETNKLQVYRQDKLTKLKLSEESIISPQSFNGVQRVLHIGGMHLFIDTYEHVMMFNNYTTENVLLYDPFIGLNVTKFELLFNRQPEFTQRPNVGGYVNESFFNQGTNLIHNFDSSVENLRYAYDTYETLESNLMTQYSRKSLGYGGVKDYLSNLNLSKKSQFIFWRGQIQHKGSVNAVTAFINSRRFIDAKVDDYWAVKIGRFGSVEEKEYPELYVTTVDSRSNELRLEFIPSEATSSDENFVPIKMNDIERWYNQPDQVETLLNNGRVLGFDMKTINRRSTEDSVDPLVIVSKLKYDIDTSTSTTRNYIIHNMDCDSVEIVHNGTTLLNEEYETVPGLSDYRIINNNVVEIFNIGSPVGEYIIYALVYDNDAQNPARLVDRLSETQVSTIEYWNPARGSHHYNAIHNIDLLNGNDPARYNTSTSNQSTLFWDSEQVGTTWFDINKLGYKPYNSKEVILDDVERFRQWGQMSEWSEVKLYEWVESDIPPSEWDAIATNEENVKSIDESIRKSGKAKKTILYLNQLGDYVTAKTNVIVKYPGPHSDISLSPAVDYVFTISAAEVADLRLNINSKYIVDVYVNGILVSSSIELIPSGGDYIVILDSNIVNDNSIVEFVQSIYNIPSTDYAGSPPLYKDEYEYTSVEYYDDLNIKNTKYYFWVEDKTTNAVDRNRTMPIKAVKNALVNIPNAYMFFQGIKPTETVYSDEQSIISRSEYFVNNTLSTFQLALSIALNTSIVVEKNGVELQSSDFSVDYNTSIVTVNLPVINTDIIRITYTGVYTESTILGYRYTKVIMRGLQGIVNSDRRYTVRFTRDFTLRDKLLNDNINTSDLELKNLHEEWKIFRKEQQFHIDRWLWDRITESIVGFKLDNNLIRVPSYERELYDLTYHTDTKYGLGVGQAFVDGKLALGSILAYLYDPSIDFRPIDINTFLIDFKFDTNEDIVKTMDEIYNTFTYTHVNRMFFSVLMDAFTTKKKYNDIFKTSMVSLHGIRPFQTSGIFDD